MCHGEHLNRKIENKRKDDFIRLTNYKEVKHSPTAFARLTTPRKLKKPKLPEGLAKKKIDIEDPTGAETGDRLYQKGCRRTERHETACKEAARKHEKDCIALCGPKRDPLRPWEDLRGDIKPRYEASMKEPKRKNREEGWDHARVPQGFGPPVWDEAPIYTMLSDRPPARGFTITAVAPKESYRPVGHWKKQPKFVKTDEVDALNDRFHDKPILKMKKNEEMRQKEIEKMLELVESRYDEGESLEHIEGLIQHGVRRQNWRKEEKKRQEKKAEDRAQERSVHKNVLRMTEHTKQSLPLGTESHEVKKAWYGHWDAPWELGGGKGKDVTDQVKDLLDAKQRVFASDKLFNPSTKPKEMGTWKRVWEAEKPLEGLMPKAKESLPIDKPKILMVELVTPSNPNGEPAHDRLFKSYNRHLSPAKRKELEQMEDQNFDWNQTMPGAWAGGEGEDGWLVETAASTWDAQDSAWYDQSLGASGQGIAQPTGYGYEDPSLYVHGNYAGYEGW